MIGNIDLQNFTTNHFDSINFGEISERWIDDLIDNDFTDAEEIRMTSNILFTDDPLESLNGICIVCEKWCSRIDFASFNGNDSHNPDESTLEEEVLWTYLNGMDITVKQILGMVYLLCFKATKTSSSIEDKELGLSGAKFYFCCLKVPGSTAYSVFHPNLFRLCIDCLQMPSHIPETRDAVYVWRDFENILPMFISALESLVPLLSKFHLGSDDTTVDYTIQKLTELVACEIFTTNFNFDRDFLAINTKERRRHYSQTHCVTALAYQGLLSFIKSDLNGDKESNCAVIMSGLNYHILCVRVRKSTTIPHKFVVIKDNAVSFIKFNLQHDKELFSKAAKTSLKRLCLSVSDKADFRATVSNAVFKIMFDLEKADLIEFIQWLLLLADSSETSNRAFALEALGQLLADNVPTIDKEGLPQSDVIYTTLVPVIFTILTRCDDVSAVVRAKSLYIVSQNMEKILNSLMDVMKDDVTAPYEEFEENFETDVNGNHRAFWYNLNSYRKILDEVAAILYRRAEDLTVAARKAALQALESLITFDATYLSDEYLKLFVSAAKDANITSRKQVIQSLTTVLDASPNNSLAQDCWLRCVSPLVHDPETSVQVKALVAMEDRFLRHIFSPNIQLKECTFSLLEKLSRGKYLSHQRYLQKAFSFWKTEKKLGSLRLAVLEQSFGQGKDDSIWFYLSIFSGFSKLPPKLSERAVEAFEDSDNWTNDTSMEHILKILGYTFTNLSAEKLNSVVDILMGKLRDFMVPMEIMPLMIEILNKVQKYLKNREEFSNFADEIMKICKDYLSNAASWKNQANRPSDELIAKCLTIVKEFCHIFPNHITSELITILKPFYSASSKRSTIDPILRAHAFAAIGKIALQDETLAKELIPDLAHELKQSQEDATRNNVAIILIEMCKRYTSLADRYLPIISRCFKDRVYLIRYQAITLLVTLLQEGYIKWKGNLFFCLLSTIIDKKEAIQELGKYCLCELLMEKKQSIFSDHFVDSIFVFNGFEPPDNEGMSQLVKELKIFALSKPNQQEERLQLYKFMLTYMNEGARTYLIPQLSRNILLNIAENVYPFNSVTEQMVRDCFAIISSNEIRVFDMDHLEDDIDEGDRERVVTAEKEARKVIIIEPIMPAIISLKNCVAAERSDLMTDIIFFLKELLHDFVNELSDILAADLVLGTQVGLEFRIEMTKQEKEEFEKSNKKDNIIPIQNGNENPCSRSTVYSANVMKNVMNKEIEDINRESGINGTSQPPNTPLRLPSRASMVKSVLPRSVVKTQNMEIDSMPSTSRGSSFLNFPPGVNFASTPRVVLNKLKVPDIPDLTQLVFTVDEESDYCG